MGNTCCSEESKLVLNQDIKQEVRAIQEYQKTRPLCFSARTYQKSHPEKLQMGYRDADATLISPLLLGVADGVSQLEDYGMDASELPVELLQKCEELANARLFDDRPSDVELLKTAYLATRSLGSTTVLLAAMDNAARSRTGRVDINVLTLGDSALLVLRRCDGQSGQLQPHFYTERRRVDGKVQTPLQLARVDHRIDPTFEASTVLRLIDVGADLHCITVNLGDLIVLGSDGVFDNLFIDEIVELCNCALPCPLAGVWVPSQPQVLGQIAQRVVKEALSKSEVTGRGIFPETPIGPGGKIDDTSVVIAEVVEWSESVQVRGKPEPL